MYAIRSGGLASPTSASLTGSPTSASSSSIKPEHKQRHDRFKAPDRVAFVAASKEGFTRMSGASSSSSSSAAGAHRADDEHADEKKRNRLTKLADRMDVEGNEDGRGERKAGQADGKGDEEAEVEEEEDEDTLNRYKPISVPFRKQRSAAPTTSTSSPYPARSAATIITQPSTDNNNNLLFFQLPSHLPLHPSTTPTPPPTTTTTTAAVSSTILPGKTPTLLTGTASSASSFLANKTLLQKKKLLTFDPQFANSLQFVQPGTIGRLLVYRSGRVKMEVGGVRLDVERGLDCLYHQQVVSVHAEAAATAAAAEEAEAEGTAMAGGKVDAASGGRREWVELGDVRERLVCTMDVDDLQRKRDSRGRVGGSQMDKRSDEKAMAGDVKMKEEKI